MGGFILPFWTLRGTWIDGHPFCSTMRTGWIRDAYDPGIDTSDHTGDNGVVMTTPQRSTRRSVNPPEGEETPKEEGKHTHDLAEVESILDEIENLVSRKSDQKEETAKSTPVFEEQSQNDGDVDLGRLERELQSAIATEFEKVTQDSTDSSENGVSDSVPILTEDEDEIKKLTEVFEEAESTRSGSDAPENTQRSSNAKMTSRPREGTPDHEENGGGF